PGVVDQLTNVSLARLGDESNVGIYRWYLKLNGAAKWQSRNVDMQEHNRQVFGFFANQQRGYTMLDFADRGFMEDIFDARGFGAAAVRFELHGDWLGITAADRLDILQIEQIPVEI
ncbi:MAG: hypothetical protein ACREUY_05080, partial [Burkholderiales bacterium]